MEPNDLGRLDERVLHIRKELDEVPSKIEGIKESIFERLRFEIEQAFKLSEGERQKALDLMEGKLKAEITTGLDALKTDIFAHIDEQLKPSGSWVQRNSHLIIMGAFGVLFLGLENATGLARLMMSAKALFGM